LPADRVPDIHAHPHADRNSDRDGYANCHRDRNHHSHPGDDNPDGDARNTHSDPDQHPGGDRDRYARSHSDPNRHRCPDVHVNPHGDAGSDRDGRIDTGDRVHRDGDRGAGQRQLYV
jgi:hypothetical protein